jgi:hypothetical protein
MKTKNTKKIVVSALAVAMGAGLVGSISGTVAWYQYSTRSTTAFVGTSVGTSRNLEAKVGSATTYKVDWTTSETASVIGNTNVAPVTTGATTKDAKLPQLKGHPVYGVTSIANWRNALATEYITFPINFRVMDSVNGATATEVADKPVYLENVTIQKKHGAGDGADDISEAIRVHLSTGASNNALIAKTATSTDTNGPLKLKDGPSGSNDNNGRYEWDTGTELTYGSGVQTSYAQDDSAIIANPANPYDTTSWGGFHFTTADTLTVTIWMEGWAKLSSGSPETLQATWDAKYISEQFEVGLSFVTIAE